jgi:hypothetical protein
LSLRGNTIGLASDCQESFSWQIANKMFQPPSLTTFLDRPQFLLYFLAANNRKEHRYKSLQTMYPETPRGQMAVGAL